MRIPLIEDLLIEPVPAGSNILVEFDPTSLWYSASLTIAAGWLRTGGAVSYNAWAQPPENVRSKLKRLGLDVEELEREKSEDGVERLRIWDWYSATLGQKSKEKLAYASLKASDVSLRLARETTGMLGPAAPDRKIIGDNISMLARFNDEKAWVEIVLTRMVPMASLRKSTWIAGLIKALHSDWVYKNFEAVFDGVIDFKLDEVGTRTASFMRIRSMRNVGFDSEWHQLKMGDNLEVTFEK